MAMFQSTKISPIVLDDLEPVAKDVAAHFERQGFDVEAQPTVTGGWDISLAKGNMFKAVLGMKTALKVSIETGENNTTANAGVGIFGVQAIPTLIALFVTWPVLITQLWGMVKQAKLDDEALECVVTSLKAHAPTPYRQTAGYGAGAAFCTECGGQMPAAAKFCPECGSKRV